MPRKSTTPQPHGGPGGPGAGASNSVGTEAKRRRVVRACDRCRKLKIKCSGDMPCIHCTVYSYDCSYDDPSKAKKKLSPLSAHDHSKHSKNDPMTARMKALEDIIRKLLPETANQTNIDPVRINQMLEANERNHIQDLVDNPVTGAAASGSAGILGSVGNGVEIKIILPPLNIALDLISKTWENACVLFRFYHRPTFIKDLNDLYSTDPSQYTNKQQRFLPLVYSVLACGALFSKSDENTKLNADSIEGIGRGGTLIDANIPTRPAIKREHSGDHIHQHGRGDNELMRGEEEEEEDEEGICNDEGYKYFIAARRLIDITDTKDTYGIQTIVMLIIFLQCSARLSTCYAYIGIALRAALREGLHRKLNYQFNPIELEIRKRLFWTIYKMDIYVNTMLGLPRTITREDFDQDMPVELDDENITMEGLKFECQFRVSSSQIANCHTRLSEILKNVVTKLYPVRPKDKKGLGSVLTLSYVLELEGQLQEWLDSLPIELKPGMEPNPEYLRANRVLHLSYLHVRIVMYRPFIHYIGKPGNDWMNNKAINCIRVARVVVKLADDMIQRGILSGAYWFSVYTIFFSIACLIYYVHFSPERGSVEYFEITKDAERGKKILDTLKDSSMAARRTYNILNALFEQLNRKTANTSSSADAAAQAAAADAAVPQSSGSVNDSLADPMSSNGINYIGGVSTGIDLHQRLALDPILNAQQQQQSLLPLQEQPAPSTDNTDPMLSVNRRQPSSVEDPDGPYAAGFMDQLDTKLFGRFLPPYMSGLEVDGSGLEDPMAANGAVPAGLSTVFAPGDSLDDFVNL